MDYINEEDDILVIDNGSKMKELILLTYMKVEEKVTDVIVVNNLFKAINNEWMDRIRDGYRCC